MAKINPFAELNVEDMSELVEKYDPKTDAKTLSAIKDKAFEKAGLEKEKSKSIRFMRIALSAAAVCMVVLAAVFAVSNLKDKPQITPTETTASTSASNTDTNPLISAISKGDDSLVASLLNNSGFVSEDVLSYAMKYMNLLSYRSISEIAKAVKEKFGTTGLDPLVENAVLGNSDEVIALLNKRESLGSLNDRIAYFFSAAFCSSDTLRLFNEKGIDVKTTDENGDCVYDIAEKYGNEENQNYALSVGAEN
ncbi:MAG: hypothetical protein ACI4SB_03715 [Acutalibacteraceae bacterium]